LLNTEDVILLPVSSRSALEVKLAYLNNSGGKHYEEALLSDPRWKNSKFSEIEDYLLSFLDLSTENGKERVRLKLETPIGIADRLLTSCQRLVKLEYEKAVEDLTSIRDLVSGANNYAAKLEADSRYWQKQISSLVSVSNVLFCCSLIELYFYILIRLEYVMHVSPDFSAKYQPRAK
jgi:hypothetical protein